MEQSQEIGKPGTAVTLAAGESKDNSATSENDGTSRNKRKRKREDSDLAGESTDNSSLSGNDWQYKRKKRKIEDFDAARESKDNSAFFKNDLPHKRKREKKTDKKVRESKDNSAPSRNDETSKHKRKKDKRKENTKNFDTTGESKNNSAPSQNEGTSEHKKKKEKRKKNPKDSDPAKEKRKKDRKDSDVLLSPPADPLRHTLVLDMDHTLLAARRHKVPKHEGSEYFKLKRKGKGKERKVYVYKRPGLQLFLTEMSKLYEMGVFTLSGKRRANSFLDQIDRDRQLIKFRLYKNSADGGNSKSMAVKNLSRLGRDLRKAIIIDDKPTSYRFQQSNAIPIKRFEGLKSDSELTQLIPFLQRLSEVEDVRPVLSAKFHLGNRPVTDVNDQKSNGEGQCAAQKSNGEEQCAEHAEIGEGQCLAQKSNGEEQCAEHAEIGEGQYAAQKSNGEEQWAAQKSNGEEQSGEHAEN